MHKVNKSISTLVDTIIQQISSDYNIPLEDLQKTVDPFLKKEDHFERCQGFVPTKNNQPVCRYKVIPGTLYCRRHSPIEPSGSPIPVRTQCTSLNNNGCRCIRNAKPGETICGIHMSKTIYSSRKDHNIPHQIPCIYYEDTDDGVLFCPRHTVNKETWFCKKHAHLQTMYERMYGSKNIKHYMTNGTKSISFVDNFIKDNCGDVM